MCDIVLKATGKREDPRAPSNDASIKVADTQTRYINEVKGRDNMTSKRWPSGNNGNLSMNMTTPLKKIAEIDWYSASTDFNLRAIQNWHA
mmetsp:Transcript_33464/g.71132  ORF Transcript_33464/g.71132 Transcript_33464/m.71132 type:complete len:90 (+) Transcript_33464:202-471(+)